MVHNFSSREILVERCHDWDHEVLHYTAQYGCGGAGVRRRKSFWVEETCVRHQKLEKIQRRCVEHWNQRTMLPYCCPVRLRICVISALCHEKDRILQYSQVIKGPFVGTERWLAPVNFSCSLSDHLVNQSSNHYRRWKKHREERHAPTHHLSPTLQRLVFSPFAMFQRGES